MANHKNQAWIQFTAGVNEKTVGKFLNEVKRLIDEKKIDFHILLSTSGGSVLHGITTYNVLRALPISITTYNIGRINSIGGTFFVAGDLRYAVPNSSFLIHSVAMQVPPSQAPQFIEEKKVREYLRGIEEDRKSIASIFSERTGMPIGRVEEMMLEGSTVGTKEAKKMGIIKDVLIPKIPPGVKVSTITDIL